MARSNSNPSDPNSGGPNSWGPNRWDPIPGETPIDDVSGLIPKGITTRAGLNALEAENIRKAVMKYLAAKPTRRQAPFTLDWCYKLHRQMFGYVWTWAGTRRRTELNIGVPAYRIDSDLQSLLDDVHFWRMHPGMDAVEQAARLHHRAVRIHPFLNGNGRWARMLANIHLKLARRPPHPVARRDGRKRKHHPRRVPVRRPRRRRGRLRRADRTAPTVQPRAVRGTLHSSV